MELFVTVVTALCFAGLTAEIAYVAISLIVKDRAGRIAFLRTFKRGKCAIVFFAAIPLYFIGILYGGASVLDAFFLAISKIFGLVVLGFDVDSISALLGASLFYKITVYYAFVLVTVNAIVFTLSLISQHLWQYFSKVRLYFTSKKRLYVFGCNKNSISVYTSDTERVKAIVDSVSDEKRLELYIGKISCLPPAAKAADPGTIVARALKKGGECAIVINTEDEERNISLCHKFVAAINALNGADREKLFGLVNIYVFGSPVHEAIYGEIVSSAHGCLHYINKYRKISMDFIEKYPFTLFMDETQLDYAKATVRDGVEINVCMIGFGKTNQHIFLTSVANNQFICERDGEIELKKVNYHIFDRSAPENNKNLNHCYYRFKHECTAGEDKYLPLPSLPAVENYYDLDINDKTFYDTLRAALTRGKNDANFVIVAFGSDLENIDMAQKLVAKREEWEIGNMVVFVKTREPADGYSLFKNDCCKNIGVESRSVYNLGAIVTDKIDRMTKMRNEVYDIDDLVHSGKSFNEQTLLKIREASLKDWYRTKSQMERESSLYGCLSMRSKLNLIGLDYTEGSAGDADALSESEFMDIYAKDDKINYYETRVRGKRIVKYDLGFRPSVRTNLAIQEHYRWNSFMLSKGMIPSTIEQIRTEIVTTDDGKTKFSNGKNYRQRRHGNLTTFDGLIKFRRILADRDTSDLDYAKKEEKYDVIKNDYQLLDDAYWLLSENGFKIVRR